MGAEYEGSDDACDGGCVRTRVRTLDRTVRKSRKLHGYNEKCRTIWCVLLVARDRTVPTVPAPMSTA